MGGATDAIVQGGGVLGAVFIFCMLAMGSAFAALALYTKGLHKDYIAAVEKCGEEKDKISAERVAEQKLVRDTLLDAVRQFNETQREQTKAGVEIENAMTNLTDAVDRLALRFDNTDRTIERAMERAVQKIAETPKQGEKR